MVASGLDVLIADHLGELRGRSVGIVGNHAAVTRDLTHISDALSRSGVNVAALFGPEHGARGDIADGEEIGDSVDERLGVPVYSLYGKTKAPTPESLRGIDVMIVDVQEVGVRFYTFIYTMAVVMDACGKQGVPVWVIDRPNPISGSVMEGPVLEPGFESFVGMYPIPQRHGLTIGELSRLFNTHFGVRCDLRVLPMKGWKREMWFDETGLPWVAPSPNMPTLEAATAYPGTCLIEGTNASEGRGTTLPFVTFGAAWVKPQALREYLIDCELPGVAFREAYFTPTASKFNGERCGGVQLYVTDRQVFRPVLTGVAATSALLQLYPDQFAFRAAPPSGKCHFDLLAGNSSVREAIQAGLSPREIESEWQDGLRRFESMSRDVVLY